MISVTERTFGPPVNAISTPISSAVGGSVSGQKDLDPPGTLGNHYLVKFTLRNVLRIYDPSYGVGGYTSEWAHEDVAIDGLTRIFAGGDRAKKVLTGAANQDLTYLRRIGYE